MHQNAPAASGRGMIVHMQRQQTSHGKIAIALPDLRSGGAEKMRIRLAAQWLAAGFEVDFVLLHARGELLSSVPAGANIHALGVNRYRSAVGPLTKYLNRHQPQVLLAAMWPLTVVAIVAVHCSTNPARVVVSDHNELSEAYMGRGCVHHTILRASMALAYPFADARIAVSMGVATDLSKLSGLAEEDFTVVYNPAGGQKLHSEGARVAVHRHDPGHSILSVGTLKAQKNHKLLIEAFSRIPDRLDARLTILGDGDLRSELEQQIQELGLEERVKLPGYAADTSHYYQMADLFVLASRYEGFGNVIVEALDHGVPVVSTDCPSGPSEILDHGRFGRLVPVDDVDALCAAMIEALTSEHDIGALQGRAAEFTPEKVAKQYLDLMFPPEGTPHIPP